MPEYKCLFNECDGSGLIRDGDDWTSCTFLNFPCQVPVETQADIDGGDEVPE